MYNKIFIEVVCDEKEFRRAHSARRCENSFRTARKFVLHIKNDVAGRHYFNQAFQFFNLSEDIKIDLQIDFIEKEIL